jgi:glycolate oxidase iron-sulfur subunit
LSEALPEMPRPAPRLRILSADAWRTEDRPSDEDFLRCVHCGLCLNQCPTYRLWGREADSPRGRIRQMMLVAQGEIPLDGGFVTHIDRCLDCRACETACPSGVEYGRLVESARAQIEANYRRPLMSRLLRRAAMRHLLPYPNRIALVARAMRAYQRSGAQGLARRSGALRLLGLQTRERLLPPIDSEFFSSRLGKTFPAAGQRRARVAFFAGCIAQVAFARLNDATIRVLQANGCEVVVPQRQLCCGALAAHAGQRDIARALARINLDAFAREPLGAIVTNTAGCGSTLKEYSSLFRSNEPQHAMAEALAARVRDVTEFLDMLGLSAPLGELPLRVTWQDSCHLLHGQRIGEAPRRLLKQIPGVELVEMPGAGQCCGSAGIYNVLQPGASLALLAEKMAAARSTGAACIVTANPGCMLQMRAGAEMHQTGQEVSHLVELLDRSIACSQASQMGGADDLRRAAVILR